MLNIRTDDFYGIEIPLPPKMAEQQKISHCLSSLEELIAAEDDRLATLRDHKKGLMNALFPAPGQTVPRLRFPEFKKAGRGRSDRLVKLPTIRMVRLTNPI